MAGSLTPNSMGLRVCHVSADRGQRTLTKLGGPVDLMPTGSLQNDGKIISDERG